jgi:hypothetical protein
MPRFFPALQRGFAVKAQIGSSIESLLCQQFGLSPEYLDKRIQTIFLDGRPVDDVVSVTVRQGSILALSAAMPGLVGATLRRGGFYAPMRKQISHKEGEGAKKPHAGTIFLKLFNLVLRELGPSFLKRGIWLKGEDLDAFFKGQPDDFWEGCMSALLDGEDLDPKRLPEMAWKGGQVHIKIITA